VTQLLENEFLCITPFKIQEVSEENNNENGDVKSD